MEELPDSYTDLEKRILIYKNILSRSVLLEWQEYYYENSEGMTEDEKADFCTQYKEIDIVNIYPMDECSDIQ